MSEDELPAGPSSAAEPDSLIADLPGAAEDDLGAESGDVDARILEQLVAEHAEDRIGQTWVNELVPICRRLGIKYHSRVYADDSQWGPEAFDDLLQDTVVRLLSKGQVEYIVDVAQDLGHVRALLHKQVRYTLVDRRRTTLIDNLLARAPAVLNEAPFVVTSSLPASWTLAADEVMPGSSGGDEGVRSETESLAVRSALMFRLRRLPRLPAKGVERASPLWSRATLKKALEDISATLGPVTLDDLRSILNDGLTSVTVTEISDDDAGAFSSALAIGPDDEAEANEVLERLLEELNDEELAVLAGKFQGRSDSDISHELRMSRPTVVVRRESASRRIQGLLLGSNDHVRDFVLQRFQNHVLGLDGRVEDV